MSKTMTKTITSVALLAAGSLYMGGAVAQGIIPAQAGEYSADRQWIRMPDPERDWAVAPHQYEFKGGKLTHVDSLDHEQPRPAFERRSTQNRPASTD